LIVPASSNPTMVYLGDIEGKVNLSAMSKLTMFVGGYIEGELILPARSQLTTVECGYIGLKATVTFGVVPEPIFPGVRVNVNVPLPPMPTLEMFQCQEIWGKLDLPEASQMAFSCKELVRPQGQINFAKTPNQKIKDFLGKLK